MSCKQSVLCVYLSCLVKLVLRLVLLAVPSSLVETHHKNRGCRTLIRSMSCMRQKKMEEVMRLKCKVTIAAALFCLSTVFAYSDDGKEVKGMIKSRSGETMVVQTDSTDVTVVLTEGTKT